MFVMDFENVFLLICGLPVLSRIISVLDAAIMLGAAFGGPRFYIAEVEVEIQVAQPRSCSGIQCMQSMGAAELVVRT